MKFTFWKNNPAFKLLIPMILGIAFAVLFNWRTHSFLSAGISLLLIYVVLLLLKARFKTRLLKGCLLSAIVFCFAVHLVVVKTQINQSSHFSHYLTTKSKLVVSLNEQLSTKANSFKGNLKVSHVINGNTVIPSQGLILGYLAKDKGLDNLKYGDEFIIDVVPLAVSEPANPEQFNYKYYLTLNNINHQVYLREKNVVKLNSNIGNSLISSSYKIRDYCYQTLNNNGVEGNQLKVASALLLGYQEKLDKDLIQSYSSAGAMHVLAVSGLHVGILFFILKFSFSALKRLPKGKWLFLVSILLSLWFYAMMTGFSPSVLRATTMFSFLLVGEEIIYRKTSIYNTLAVSGILLLLFNPYLIFEVGFQLSYLAVVGIVYLQPKIYNLIYVKNIVLDNAWKITAVSIAAQLATFPLGLYYFHQFPVYFFISNLIVIPAATLIIYLGVLLFITAPMGGVSLLFGKALNAIIGVLNWSVKLTEELAYSLVQEISITRLETYMMYLIFVVILFGVYYKKFNYFLLSTVLVMCFLTIQLVERYQNLSRKEMTVYAVKNKTAIAFNKGKEVYFMGDSTLYQDESAMLFNINHHWFKRNIDKKYFINESEQIETANLYNNEGVIQFFNKKILKLNKHNVNSLNHIDFDYIIVSNQSKKLLYKLKKHQLTVDALIFDSSIPSYEVDYWRNKFTNVNLVSTRKEYFNCSF